MCQSQNWADVDTVNRGASSIHSLTRIGWVTVQLETLAQYVAQIGQALPAPEVVPQGRYLAGEVDRLLEITGLTEAFEAQPQRLT